MISNGIPYQKFTDLQTAAFSLAHFSKILRYCPLRSCLLQKQALTGSLQNNCSKQQLKLADRPASVLEKDVLVDFYFTINLERQNLKLRKAKWNLSNDNADVDVCWCWYFEMVHGNNSWGTKIQIQEGNWAREFFLTFKKYLHLIFLKL